VAGAIEACRDNELAICNEDMVYPDLRPSSTVCLDKSA
jgi:hypothetical protein